MSLTTAAESQSAAVFLSIESGKSRDQWPVIRRDAPLRHRVNVSAGWFPFAGHPTAQQKIIDARIGIFFREKMGPGDLAIGAGLIGDCVRVAVPFGGARVDERILAAADNRARGS